jgi:phasin family protein
MANPRQEDKSARNPEDTMRRAADYTAAQAGQIGQATAEQTKRLGKAAADTGEEVARLGAELLQQNAETLQNTWRLGLETASAFMGRSTDHLGRTLGLAGDGAQKATERSARNYETILYATTAASSLMEGMSREYLGLVRQQMEKTMERMNDLWSCRTPQDVAAAQSELARESVGTLLESSRRVADMSLKSVEDAAKHMNENMESARSAA